MKLVFKKRKKKKETKQIEFINSKLALKELLFIRGTGAGDNKEQRIINMQINLNEIWIYKILMKLNKLS